jgi:hypothetical protein
VPHALDGDGVIEAETAAVGPVGFVRALDGEE